VCKAGRTYFHVGAGIVADSIPSAEYDETMAKAGGFFAALQSATDRFPRSLGAAETKSLGEHEDPKPG